MVIGGPSNGGILVVRFSLGVSATGSSLDASMCMVAHPERIVARNNDTINFIKMQSSI
jgi:hypothetical protein